MKTLKELRLEVLKGVYSFLIQHGYTKRMHECSFWKKTDFGRTMVYIGFINHKDDFDVTLSFSIRFNKVEDLKNEIATYLKDKGKKETSTIGCELGNYLGIGQWGVSQIRWTVLGEEDVNPVVKFVTKAITDHVFPFFKKYSNLEVVYELVKRDDDEAGTISIFNQYRGMNAVAIAYLLEKTDEIEDIIKTKVDLMKSIDDLNINSFLKFVDHMKKNYL